MRERLKQHIKTITLLILMNAFAIIALHELGALKPLERWAYDWRVKNVRAEAELDPEVAVVLIDDASLKALEGSVGRWPWPRAVYGALLDYFSYASPKAVMFDVTFTEKQKSDDDDAYLVDATSASPYAYHATRFVLDPVDEVNKSLLNRPLPEEFVDFFSVNKRFQLESPTPLPGFSGKENNNYYIPIDELWQSSPALGVVEVNSDDDGIYRRARLLHRYQDHHYPALSIAPLLDRWEPRRIERKDNKILFDDFAIPVDDDEKYLVNYYARYRPYSISGIMATVQQIQNGEVDNLVVSPFEFENKYVYIGASAAGLLDLKRTPVDGRLPGVLIHASITSNILNKDFLKLAPNYITPLSVITSVFLTIFGIFLFRHGAIQSLVPITFGAVVIAGGYYLFKENIVVNLASPISGIASSWLSAFAALALTEGKDKRRFKRMMSQYLSPAVLNTVVDNHEEFARAGVGSKEEISILFSDIRGFTNMSESLEPEIVVDILNHYFSEMTDAIFQTEGTIDKFIGDAIMAFWGAPVKTDDHALQAVKAALNMNERLPNVNDWLKEQNYPELAIGIGLHTGFAILGNIGSDTKLDYTIIGDTVNLASRMEGLTKQYGCSILITENTHQELGDKVLSRIVDQVRVKGKLKPVRIFQPLALTDNLEDAKRQALQTQVSLTKQAFDAYLNKQWDEAIRLLEQLPDDRVRELHMERCRHYIESPPEDDWDGVFTMTTK